jgi:hypothetical protein
LLLDKGGKMESMTPNPTFYEQARELGEVIRHGLRYRMYYDAERELMIYVLVPGQTDKDAGKQVRPAAPRA